MNTLDIQKYFYNLGMVDITKDGIKGQQTQTYIKSFQTAFKLTIDGIVGQQTISQMNKISKGTTIDTSHFKQWEFNCRCCNKNIGIPIGLLIYLEMIRRHFKNPIHIISGYRCKSHNANVGGAKYSQHLYGKAADILIYHTNHSDVYNYCNKILSNNGLGKYSWGNHIDIRGHKSRW